MSKHPYTAGCDCKRCSREAARRTAQANRTTPQVMQDWYSSRNPRRARIAREYWDDFQSGRPMSDDDR